MHEGGRETGGFIGTDDLGLMFHSSLSQSQSRLSPFKCAHSRARALALSPSPFLLRAGTEGRVAAVVACLPWRAGGATLGDPSRLREPGGSLLKRSSSREVASRGPRIRLRPLIIHHVGSPSSTAALSLTAHVETCASIIPPPRNHRCRLTVAVFGGGFLPLLIRHQALMDSRPGLDYLVGPSKPCQTSRRPEGRKTRILRPELVFLQGQIRGGGGQRDEKTVQPPLSFFWDAWISQAVPSLFLGSSSTGLGSHGHSRGDEIVQHLNVCCG